MARVLLGAVASAVLMIFPALAAAAQDEGPAMRSPESFRSIRDGRDRGPCRGDRPGGSEDARVQCGAFAGGWAYADGEWALYNNRSWGPDSFNDWWNDRPDRAYPRWVREQRRQRTCEPDRMWWSGSGWHC